MLEIKERKERRDRSSRAAALSAPVEAGEEDVLDDDGEEEREVSYLLFFKCYYRLSVGPEFN